MFVWLVILGTLARDSDSVVNLGFQAEGPGLPIAITEYNSLEPLHSYWHGTELGFNLELDDMAKYLREDCLYHNAFSIVDDLCHDGYWISRARHRIDNQPRLPIRIKRDDIRSVPLPGIGWHAFCAKWDSATRMHLAGLLEGFVEEYDKSARSV